MNFTPDPWALIHHSSPLLPPPTTRALSGKLWGKQSRRGLPRRAKNAQACKKRQRGTAIDKDRESLSKCEIGQRHRAKLPSTPFLTDRAPTLSSDDRKGRRGPDFEQPFCVSYYHPFGNGVRMSTQWKTDTGDSERFGRRYIDFSNHLLLLGFPLFPLLDMLGFVPPPSAAHNERVSAHRHLLASSSFGHCSALSPTAVDSYVGTDHASTKDYNNRNTRLCPPMLEH